jgi:endonuclease/exonuclease/phosphatase (EEP) superfamily protein YafD
VSPAANPFGRTRGVLGRAGLVVLLAAQALVLASVQGGTAQGATAQAAVESASDITFVTANLRSPQTATGFQQDAAEVFAQDPDLISYNEVAFRKDMFLAPDGYALWRTPGHYTGHNPVAWRTDTWHAVDQGTWQISNYTKRPPGKQTLLGLRYANWVSLESVDGRRLSLVAVHVAPPFKDDQGKVVDLLRPSVRRLSTLVEQLNSFGPVLAGGDFNVNYRSGRYPRDLLTEARLKPTYDLLGGYFPTGDHHGGTIDYVFLRPKGQLQVDWHRPVELNSDHDAVVAGLSWTTDPPQSEVTTVVRSRPDGTEEERLAVATALREHLASTAAGDTVRVATRGLNLALADRALRNAEARGVRVQFTSLSARLTWRERGLRQALDANGSWLRRCQADCRTAWMQDKPPSLLLVTGANGDEKVRIDVSRRLRRAVVTRRTTARITTSRSAMTEARAAFAGL